MRQHLLAKLTLSAALTASLACGAVSTVGNSAPKWNAGAGWKSALPHYKAADPKDYKVRQAKASRLDKALASVRFQQTNPLLPGAALNGLATGQPDHVMDAGNHYGYLDGPDGTTWFYTGGPILEEVQYEYYTDRIITGYEYTVYDSKFNRVGSISDKITLQGDELRAASIGIDAAVTRKFFNSQSDNEVMVVLFFNNPDYSVTTRTMVYTLDGARDEEGNSTSIATYPGMPIDAVNMAADKWSEDFFITFRDETHPDPDDFTEYTDYLQACAYELTVYKKGAGAERQSKCSNTPSPRPSSPAT